MIPIPGTCLYSYVTTKEKRYLDNGGELPDWIIDAACSRNRILTMMEEIANNLLQQHRRALSQSSNAMQVIHIDEKR